MMDLAQLFDKTVSKWDKFLARLLGLFSEDIVRIWTQDSLCPYENLGRPTIVPPDMSKQFTPDFTLSLKSPQKTFVTEMKCWTEYDGYRFLNLAADKQLEKISDAAFKLFLSMANHPEKFVVKVSQKQIDYDGIILIWSRAEPDVIESVKRTYGLYDVLTLENIVNDLHRWNNQQYREFLDERAAWCSYLFTGFVVRGKNWTESSGV